MGRSGAEGDQLKEATHINTSLSALGERSCPDTLRLCSCGW